MVRIHPQTPEPPLSPPRLVRSATVLPAPYPPEIEECLEYWNEFCHEFCRTYVARENCQSQSHPSEPNSSCGFHCAFDCFPYYLLSAINQDDARRRRIEETFNTMELYILIEDFNFWNNVNRARQPQPPQPPQQQPQPPPQ